VRRLLWVCLAAPLGAWAAGTKAPPQGGVDWQGQVLTATGQGAPNLRATSPAQARLGAERAAQLDALRNLLEQVKGVQLTATKKVGDALADESVATRVQGVIRNFKVLGKPRYFSDNGVEIDVQVPLSGIVAALEEGAAPVPVNGQGAAKTTGLVIDARGLKVVPALSPRVLDPDGKVVYAAGALAPDAKGKTTVAGYFEKLEKAQASDRVGQSPRLVKAVKADGADLVIAADDAAQIRAENDAYLAEGRVAIVADATAH
jgi:hypothetical protein